MDDVKDFEKDKVVHPDRYVGMAHYTASHVIFLYTDLSPAAC